jgi:hypothetical protein
LLQVVASFAPDAIRDGSTGIATIQGRVEFIDTPVFNRSTPTNAP